MRREYFSDKRAIYLDGKQREHRRLDELLGLLEKKYGRNEAYQILAEEVFDRGRVSMFAETIISRLEARFAEFAPVAKVDGLTDETRAARLAEMQSWWEADAAQEREAERAGREERLRRDAIYDLREGGGDPESREGLAYIEWYIAVRSKP